MSRRTSTPAVDLDNFNGPLAQLVEHLTLNQGVEGSSPSWITKILRPVGQAVKTPPFHGGIKGSIPLRVTTFGRLAQLGERLPYKQDVGGSIPSSPTKCNFRTCNKFASPFCRVRSAWVQSTVESSERG